MKFPVKTNDLHEQPGQVLSLGALIPRVLAAQNLIIPEAAMILKG
jgi:hypothetical protein